MPSNISYLTSSKSLYFAMKFSTTTDKLHLIYFYLNSYWTLLLTETKWHACIVCVGWTHIKAGIDELNSCGMYSGAGRTVCIDFAWFMRVATISVDASISCGRSNKEQKWQQKWYDTHAKPQNSYIFQLYESLRHMEKYLQRQIKLSQQEKLSPLRLLRQRLEHSQPITDEILN